MQISRIRFFRWKIRYSTVFAAASRCFLVHSEKNRESASNAAPTPTNITRANQRGTCRTQPNQRGHGDGSSVSSTVGCCNSGRDFAHAPARFSRATFSNSARLAMLEALWRAMFPAEGTNP